MLQLFINLGNEGDRRSVHLNSIPQNQWVRIVREISRENHERRNDFPRIGSCSSSTFETVVGAYYLDGDRQIEKVRPLIEELFDSVQDHVIERRSQIDAKEPLSKIDQD